ncbi:MAG: GNAT family N-acetyltransferase [Burkholderiales bacterium]|jgi:GNAT superfamily N-acetyltransferase
MKIDFLGEHPEFVPELARLHFDEWRHFSPGKTYDDRVAKLQAIAASNNLPFMFVALEGNQLIGSAALVYEDMSTRKDLSPWLASVFVKPGFRRRGIATALVEHVEETARQHGKSRLYLHTEHARRLYAGLGWNDLQVCEYQGVRVTIMFKDLVASRC